LPPASSDGIIGDPGGAMNLTELRDSCLNCVRKHLSQAEVLMGEAVQGYPEHRWLAIGHMGEAADECCKDFPKLAAEIRKHRTRYMADPSYSVPIMGLIEKASSMVKTESDQPARDLDETLSFLDEAKRRREEEKLSAYKALALLNREADEDYLKWVYGYASRYNERAGLDAHGPGGTAKGAAEVAEQAEVLDDERTDGRLAEGSWKDKFSEQWPGGPVSQDEKLFKDHGHTLGDWLRKFMDDNIPKKAKGWLASKGQAKWYKTGLEELEKAAKAGGAPPPPPKKKKKFKPSHYQQAIFDWVAEASKKDKAALVVDAKAGAGKSTTMEQALEFVPPGQKAVFLAFNTDIANALAERVKDLKNVEAATINAYGRASVVKAFKKGGKPPELVKNKNRLICDELVKKLAPNEKVADKYESNYGYDMGEVITKRKMMGQLDEKGEMKFPPWKEVLDKFEIDLPTSSVPTDEYITPQQVTEVLDAAFQQSVDDKTTMEYADQVLWPVMHDLPIISRATGKKASLDWAMVDEVQDLCPLEREFAKRLAPRHMLVGDPNQSIYAFKGSDPDSMEKMQKELGAEEKPLSICYRCPQKVITEAQAIVPTIEAAPGAPEGSVKTIKHGEFYETLKPGDFVLCRTNAPNVAAALGLIAQGKKANVVGRDIGKSLSRLVERIGGKKGHKTMPIDQFAAKVQDWHMKETKRLTAEKKEHLLQGLDDKRDCLQALMSKGDVKVAGDLVKVVQQLFVSDPTPAINFSSVHKAKGLEADNVFIQRPDLLPLPMALKSEDPVQIQQEENLKYVAITRAKKALTWVLPPPKEGEEEGPPAPLPKPPPEPKPVPPPAPEPEKPKAKKTTKKKTTKKKTTKKKTTKKKAAKKKAAKKKGVTKADIAKLMAMIPDTSTMADWGESIDPDGATLFERVVGSLTEDLSAEDQRLADEIVAAHERPVDDEMWQEVRRRIHGHPDGVRTEEREVNRDGTMSCGVFLPVPSNLARYFPDKSEEDDSVPHFTVLYAGDLSPADYGKLVDAVGRVARSHEPFLMRMGGYGEFTNNDGQTIPHMIGSAWPEQSSLNSLHEALRKAAEQAGIPIAHTYGPDEDPKKGYAEQFKAHATLAYINPGEPAYTGYRPEGSWKVTDLELWGHEKYQVPLGATVSDGLTEATATKSKAGPKDAKALVKDVESVSSKLAGKSLKVDKYSASPKGFDFSFKGGGKFKVRPRSDGSFTVKLQGQPKPHYRYRGDGATLKGALASMKSEKKKGKKPPSPLVQIAKAAKKPAKLPWATGEPGPKQAKVNGIMLFNDLGVDQETWDRYAVACKDAVGLLKKRGFGFMLPNVTMHLRAGHPGVLGNYDMKTKIVEIFVNSIGAKKEPAKIMTTMVHELGHHYYYREIPRARRKTYAWYFGLAKQPTEKGKETGDFPSVYGASKRYEDFAEIFAAYIGKGHQIQSRYKLTKDIMDRFRTFMAPDKRVDLREDEDLFGDSLSSVLERRELVTLGVRCALCEAEEIPGGKAKGKKPSDFDAKELAMGIEVEKEHLVGGGYSKAEMRAKAQEIAMDHLAEIPDYYTRLKRMEKEAGVEEEDDPTAKQKAKLVAFVKANPGLDDDKFHAYAEKLGLDPHDAEEVIYAHVAKQESVDFPSRYSSPVQGSSRTGVGTAPVEDPRSALTPPARRRKLKTTRS